MTPEIKALIELREHFKWSRDNELSVVQTDQKELRRAETILAAIGVLGSGEWKLAPLIPTKEMCEAAPSMPPIHATDDLHLRKAGWSMNAISNLKRYIAMLKAAP